MVILFCSAVDVESVKKRVIFPSNLMAKQCDGGFRVLLLDNFVV
ncbi:MAG TPA: hypothetical protein PLH74_04845 [Tenuifilaceae bacterium]|nr:hypothetical protein [Tenuifilaceae bacterium]